MAKNSKNDLARARRRRRQPGNVAVHLGVSASAQPGTIITATDTPITLRAADLTVDADVIPAPEVIHTPLELVIAEVLAADPDFYRRFVRFTADELKGEIVKREGKPVEGNSGAVISTELIQFQRGFDSAATDLESANPERYTRAANTIIAIRDSIAQFCESYPDFARIFFQVPAVALGFYVLHKVGMPDVLASLMSFAIVRNEKLADGAAKDDTKKSPLE